MRKYFLCERNASISKLNLINQRFPTKSAPATEQPLESNVTITQAMTDETQMSNTYENTL